MKRFGLMLACMGIATSSAWADDSSFKSDLPVIFIEKSTLPQIILDSSMAEGKGDLLGPGTKDVLIKPASAGAFEMVPDKQSIPGVAECALSSVSVEKVRSLITKVAREESFDERLALAVAAQESGFNPNALSDKGAMGVMQLMAGTAADLQVNRCDPADNARGGMRYLKSLMVRFGNPVFALAAYNAGPDNVTKHKGIPPFPETVQYVARVLNRYYGAPETPSGNVIVASMTPVKALAKHHTPKDIEVASDKPASPGTQAWASGFVLHLN